jgi:uncharacterized membrane protein YvbJ
MKEDFSNIKELLERFFEGETSNEEEQILYRFFSLDDLPEEWVRYKPVLKYFESGFADEMSANELPTSKTMSSKRKLWITWSGIAASFLLLLSIYFLTANETLDPYAGSYIIRNGVRITDLDQIRPELEAAIQKSLLLEQEAEQLIERLSSIDDSQEEQIMQKLQDYNQQILDDIQDENVRDEVKEFLNLNL